MTEGADLKTDEEEVIAEEVGNEHILVDEEILVSEVIDSDGNNLEMHATVDTVSRVNQHGKFVYKSIEEFRTKVHVNIDSSCGYHVIMIGLNTIGKRVRPNIKVLQKNIRNFSFKMRIG